MSRDAFADEAVEAFHFLWPKPERRLLNFGGLSFLLSRSRAMAFGIE